MSTSRASEWVNLVASVGVLAGLILVACEIRQTNEIAEAETFRTMWKMAGELNRLGVETDVLNLVRKSVNDPSTLSDEAIGRLDAYFALLLEVQIVKAVMADSYGLYPVTVQEQARDIVDNYLSGRFARAWFASNKPWIEQYHPEFASAVDARLAMVPIELGTSYEEELRSQAVELGKND